MVGSVMISKTLTAQVWSTDSRKKGSALGLAARREVLVVGTIARRSAV